jgi:hypothetical protein
MGYTGGQLPTYSRLKPSNFKKPNTNFSSHRLNRRVCDYNVLLLLPFLLHALGLLGLLLYLDLLLAVKVLLLESKDL